MGIREAAEKFGLYQGHTWCFDSPAGNEWELTPDLHLLITTLEPDRDSLQGSRYQGYADVGVIPVVAHISRDGHMTLVPARQALREAGDTADAVAEALTEVARAGRRGIPADLEPDLEVTTVAGRVNPVAALRTFEEDVVPAVDAHWHRRLGIAPGVPLSADVAAAAIRVAGHATLLTPELRGRSPRHVVGRPLVVLGGRTLRDLAVQGPAGPLGDAELARDLGSAISGELRHEMYASVPVVITGLLTAEQAEQVGGYRLDVLRLSRALEINPVEVGRRLGWDDRQVAGLCTAVRRITAQLDALAPRRLGRTGRGVE